MGREEEFVMTVANGGTARGGENDKNHVTLTVVVNTVPTAVEANIHWKMRTVMERAFEQSGTTGRDPSQWEFKDANGALINLERTVQSYGFTDGTTLFLTLAAGISG